MDQNLLHLLVAGGLSLVGIVITALIWQSAKVKTVVWWFGFSLVPISLYFLGLGGSVVDAYTTLRDWFLGLQFTAMEWVGFSLFGVGVALMLVSRVIPAKPRKKKEPAPPSAVRAPSPAAPLTSTSAEPARRTSASQPTPADHDFDEVTEILKRRGIE